MCVSVLSLIQSGSCSAYEWGTCSDCCVCESPPEQPAVREVTLWCCGHIQGIEERGKELGHESHSREWSARAGLLSSGVVRRMEATSEGEMNTPRMQQEIRPVATLSSPVSDQCSCLFSHFHTWVHQRPNQYDSLVVRCGQAPMKMRISQHSSSSKKKGASFR